MPVTHIYTSPPTLNSRWYCGKSTQDFDGIAVRYINTSHMAFQPIDQVNCVTCLTVYRTHGADAELSSDENSRRRR